MGYLSHNRGSRELGGDFHPQTVAWASRMLSAGVVVTGYQKRVHTTFVKQLNSAGCLDCVIQFIAPVWGATAPNMVSVLSSAYTASMLGNFSQSSNRVRPLDGVSWIRSGLDIGNWPAGIASNNAGQLYYAIGYTSGAEWDMGVRAPGATAEGLTLGNYNGIVYAQSGYNSQISYGLPSSAPESEHLLCFNSSNTGQQLIKVTSPGVVVNVGANNPPQEGGLMPNNVYPFCGLNTIGTGIQYNTLTRSHKAFMLFKGASHAQAAVISAAVYNYANAIIPVIVAGSYLMYNGINMVYDGADILFTN